jgi:hypothetical protein
MNSTLHTRASEDIHQRHYMCKAKALPLNRATSLRLDRRLSPLKIWWSFLIPQLPLLTMIKHLPTMVECKWFVLGSRYLLVPFLCYVILHISNDKTKVGAFSCSKQEHKSFKLYDKIYSHSHQLCIHLEMYSSIAPNNHYNSCHNHR